MSDPPRRTNTYSAGAVSERYRECLFEWLGAHAPLWNQLTYRRRQAYFAEDGDVWAVEYDDLYEKYAPVLGKATCQQLARKNAEAWRSHFELLSDYHDDADPTVTDRPAPPGYWGNREEGYDLHGVVRNDLYTIEWDPDRSTLEFGVGEVLEDRYDFAHNERLTLQIKGDPQWHGDDSRLELTYDDAADVVRVHHPVRLRPETLREQRLDGYTHTLDTENTTHTAAIDIGANNTLAIVTETGDTGVYHARPEFERFRATSERIASLQSSLPDDRDTSRWIQRLYDRRGRRRDHARDAAVRHAAEWLLARNVQTVYVGDLTDVLESHWSATVNEKTHAFWSHRQLVERIRLTFEDAGITVRTVSERDSSSVCPACGSSSVRRDGDELRCLDCHLDAHADLAGAWNLLATEVGPMARPAALSAGRDRDPSPQGGYWEWNGHDWTPAETKQSRPPDQTSVGEPARSQPG